MDLFVELWKHYGMFLFFWWSCIMLDYLPTEVLMSSFFIHYYSYLVSYVFCVHMHGYGKKGDELMLLKNTPNFQIQVCGVVPHQRAQPRWTRWWWCEPSSYAGGRTAARGIEPESPVRFHWSSPQEGAMKENMRGSRSSVDPQIPAEQSTRNSLN